MSNKNKYIPINKGNYSLETPERERLFAEYSGEGWKEEYESYRSSWVENAKTQFVADYPLLVDLELSTICNLKCPMCYTNTDSFKNKVPRKYMDYGLFTKIIDEIGTNVPAIRLSLRGEATLHNEFIECIKYAKSKGIKEVSFLTNASTLTADYFEEILKAGADWITISVDGLGSTYESIRKPLTFDQIITTIKMIKSVKDKYNSHKPVIKIQSIWPAIRENPELFYDTFVEYVDIIAFNPLIDYLSNDSDILYENGFVCPQLYQRLVVGVDGRVMICANDEEGTVIVGDANDQTVHQIWHGKNMNKYRELYKKKDGFMELALCRKCYLPRLTGDYEEAFVHGRKVLINNYVNRKQVVGR